MVGYKSCQAVKLPCYALVYFISLQLVEDQAVLPEVGSGTFQFGASNVPEGGYQF